MDGWVIPKQIEKLSEFVRSASAYNRNALWSYFGITQRARTRAPNDPVQAKLDLVLTELKGLTGLTQRIEAATNNATLDRAREVLKEYGRVKNEDIIKRGAGRAYSRASGGGFDTISDV